jgi:hypothetical protein
MLIRRAVPAIAATLAVYTGLALATGLVLRGHYMTPLVTNTPTLPDSGWVLSQWYTKDGAFAFPAGDPQLFSVIARLCPSGGDSPVPVTVGGSPLLSTQQCLTRHGYTLWTSYQPGSRFWPFQWLEGGWLLALSLLLITVTVWLVRHRAT